MLKDFLTWLDAKLDPKEGNEARLLKELLADRSGALWQGDSLDEARGIVERYAQEKQSPLIAHIFGAALEEWQRTAPSPQPAPEPAVTPPKEPSPVAITDKFALTLSYLPGLAIFVISAFLVLIIWYYLTSADLVVKLGEVAIARGLITFVFTIGTIGIAVLMIAALFVGSESGLAERVGQGKEILTALIAILGTVVGFYFGSEGSTRRALQEIAIGTPVVFPTPARAGAEFQVAALASGGRLPITYAINLRSTDETLDRELQDIVGETESGLITQDLRLPAGAAGKPVLIDLEVSDEAGNSAKLMGIELQVEPLAGDAAARAASEQTGETTEGGGPADAANPTGEATEDAATSEDAGTSE